MKKLFFLSGLLCLQVSIYASSSPIKSSDRAQRHFKSNYSEAQDATWYNSGNQESYCMFHHGNEVDKVFYDSNGYWQCTLVAYSESALSKNVKNKVLGNFKDFQIMHVNEIRTPGNDPVYIINIAKGSNSKVIWVSNDTIEVRENLIQN